MWRPPILATLFLISPCALLSQPRTGIEATCVAVPDSMILYEARESIAPDDHRSMANRLHQVVAGKDLTLLIRVVDYGSGMVDETNFLKITASTPEPIRKIFGVAGGSAALSNGRVTFGSIGSVERGRYVSLSIESMAHSLEVDSSSGIVSFAGQIPARSFVSGRQVNVPISFSCRPRIESLDSLTPWLGKPPTSELSFRLD
jgi:hypothetical protein